MNNLDSFNYFTDTLFKRFIPSLKQKLEIHSSRKSITEKLILVIMFIVLVVVLIVLYVAYTFNITYLHKAQNSLNLDANKNNTIEQVESLRNVLNNTNFWQNKLYYFSSQNKSLEEFLDAKVDNYIKVRVVPLLVSFLENKLEKDLYNHDAYLMNSLKTYSMIIRNEPFDKEFVKDWYLKEKNNLHLPAEIDLETLNKIINKITPELFSQVQCNDNLYNQIILEFNNYRFAKEAYREAKYINKNKSAVSCIDFIQSNLLSAFNQELCLISIPYIYTDSGYLKYINKQANILKNILSIPSITKKLDLTSIQKSIDEANYDYIKDYSSYWNKFLSTIYLKRQDSLEKILDILKMLALDPVLFLNFLQQMNSKFLLSEKVVTIEEIKLLYGISLDEINGLTMSSKVKDLVKYKLLSNDLTSSVQSELVEAVKELIELISSVSYTINSNEASFDVIKKYEDSTDSLIKKAEQVIYKLPMPIDRVFKSLIDDIKVSLYKNAADYINQKWQEEIYEFYIDKIQGKYPFQVDNYENQLSINDFIKFFSENGVLDNFSKEYLNLTGITLNPDSNELINFSHQVKADWFSKTQTPQIQFMIIPLRMDNQLQEIVISMFGKKAIFNNQDFDPQAFDWVGSNNKSSDYVKIEFTDNNKEKIGISYSGPWSWYKFLKLDKSIMRKSIDAEDRTKIIINTPLGSFEFLIKFKTGVMLLNHINFYVPSHIVEIIN